MNYISFKILLYILLIYNILFSIENYNKIYNKIDVIIKMLIVNDK